MSDATAGPVLTAELGILLTDVLPRGTTAAPCVCGGYAEKVTTSDDEERDFGCWRYGCCCAAFKCRLCGNRLVARLHAPEMD